MCPNCRAFVTTSDRVCPYCDMRLGQRAAEQRSPGDILGGLIPHVRFTTVMILLINTALFAAEYLNPQSGLKDFGANVPWSRMDGQYWRLVTAGVSARGMFSIFLDFLGLFAFWGGGGRALRCNRPPDF